VKISVVIPCHNAEMYLAQTVGSALEQTRPPDEIIIVDDGSTDSSLEVAQRIARRFPELVHVYSQRSHQASRTRNLGALVATGDALMFLDADDLIGPDTLASLRAGLSAQPDAVAIAPWHRLSPVDGEWVQRPPSCTPRRPGQDPLNAWLTGWYHPPCSVLWSRAAFERVGRWDEECSQNQDGDLMMRALIHGVPLVEVPTGSGYYRRLPEGQANLSGQRTTLAGLEGRLRVADKLSHLLEWSGQIDRYRPALAAHYDAIADDATPAHPHLAEQARGHAREACAAEPAAAPVGRPTGRPRQLARRLYRALLQRTWQRLHPGASASAHTVIHHGRLSAARALESRADEVLAPPLHIAQPEVSFVMIVNHPSDRARAMRAAADIRAADHAELLVVLADGRTDNSALVEDDRDGRIRLLDGSSERRPAALCNIGLQRADGEYIALLDLHTGWMASDLVPRTGQLRASEGVGILHDPDEGSTTMLLRRNLLAVSGFLTDDLPLAGALTEYRSRSGCFTAMKALH